MCGESNSFYDGSHFFIYCNCFSTQDGHIPAKCRGKRCRIEDQRNLNTGIDVYLVDRYLQLSEAITKGFKDRVARVNETIYCDLSFNHFERLSSELKTMINYKPPLVQCYEQDREDIAVYLVRTGMEFRHIEVCMILKQIAMICRKIFIRF